MTGARLTAPRQAAILSRIGRAFSVFLAFGDCQSGLGSGLRGGLADADPIWGTNMKPSASHAWQPPEECPTGEWFDAEAQAPPAGELVLVRYRLGSDWVFTLACYRGRYDADRFPIDGERQRISHWLRLPPPPPPKDHGNFPAPGDRYRIYTDLDEVWEILEVGRHLDLLHQRVLIEARNLSTAEVSQFRLASWRALAPAKV